MENTLINPAALPTSGANQFSKRLLDLIGGLLGCLLLFPLYPLIALMIKLDSSGDVLFRQERIGRNGTPFTCYKFRTMVQDAESQLHHLIDIDALPEPVFKLENDPRITSVGRWLRRWSIDELPQFWNVLRGDMSLVGPRPEESRIVEKYNAHQRQRLAVRPGLSGPMQISGRANLSLHERLALELDYIENYTFRTDIQILLQTLPAVVRGDGAY